MPKRAPERLLAERIIALCREVDAAIKAAADQRVSTTRAMAALMEAQRKTARLCEEADKFLDGQAEDAARPRADRRSKPRQQT